MASLSQMLNNTALLNNTAQQYLPSRLTPAKMDMLFSRAVDDTQFNPCKCDCINHSHSSLGNDSVVLSRTSNIATKLERFQTLLEEVQRLSSELFLDMSQSFIGINAEEVENPFKVPEQFRLAPIVEKSNKCTDLAYSSKDDNNSLECDTVIVSSVDFNETMPTQTEQQQNDASLRNLKSNSCSNILPRKKQSQLSSPNLCNNATPQCYVVLETLNIVTVKRSASGSTKFSSPPRKQCRLRLREEKDKVKTGNMSAKFNHLPSTSQKESAKPVEVVNVTRTRTRSGRQVKKPSDFWLSNVEKKTTDKSGVSTKINAVPSEDTSTPVPRKGRKAARPCPRKPAVLPEARIVKGAEKKSDEGLSEQMTSSEAAQLGRAQKRGRSCPKTTLVSSESGNAGQVNGNEKSLESTFRRELNLDNVSKGSATSKEMEEKCDSLILFPRTRAHFSANNTINSKKLSNETPRKMQPSPLLARSPIAHLGKNALLSETNNTYDGENSSDHRSLPRRNIKACPGLPYRVIVEEGKSGTNIQSAKSVKRSILQGGNSAKGKQCYEGSSYLCCQEDLSSHSSFSFY